MTDDMVLKRWLRVTDNCERICYTVVRSWRTRNGNRKLSVRLWAQMRIGHHHYQCSFVFARVCGLSLDRVGDVVMHDDQMDICIKKIQQIPGYETMLFEQLD